MCPASAWPATPNQHPGDAQALYFYAMGVAKENPTDPEVETLLARAVAIDGQMRSRLPSVGHSRLHSP